MKNLKVWLLILPMFITACSDQVTAEPDKIRDGGENSAEDPSNTANPYDYAGVLYNEIVKNMDQNGLTYTSIGQVASVTDSVAGIKLEQILLPNDPSLSTRLDDLQFLLNDPQPVNKILAQSSLSQNAKAGFVSFLDSLVIHGGEPYEDIHPIIVAYEASVAADTLYSPEEKRILLTTTSVARYSVSERKRKDKDWETAVTNIVGTLLGAEINISLGIKLAAAVRVCQNNEITN